MKKIAFVSGTRADFSKLKSIMIKIENNDNFELFIFATGMHLSNKFGLTVKEIEKSGFKNIYKFINHDKYYQSSLALSSTIDGFSKFVNEYQPDLIVVHGDRIEPFAAASVGALNNILVAHIEGGEISGTIDDSLRHAISKLSHIHLVNDECAKNRLIQLGEKENSIFIIGSADIDLIYNCETNLQKIKDYYNIKFDTYAIAIFHPVTTELDTLEQQAKEFVNALKQSGKNYIVIYPNNDLGFEKILREYENLKMENNKNFAIFPSLRFEYFISLLKEAEFIIGNSSCALKEAAFLGISAINIGTRQQNRAGTERVINVPSQTKDILNAIKSISKQSTKINMPQTRSDEIFLNLLQSGVFWDIPKQKIFQDRM